ncbi:MAG TPA: hypothetical protein VHZ74_09025 [Bryobacteraceae bacterium]|nr:hypothetical protein [Bryobacteraceae bacterium]
MRLATLTLAGALAAQLTAFAQWSNYPTPGVPKLPDGKPNLTGAVPKAADGHPDLTGIWEYFRDRPANAPAPARRPPDSSLGLGPAPAGPNASPFFNIGSLTKDGLPLTPWALALRKSRAAENNKDNPDAHCLPIGLMQLHQHPQPRKIIQTPAVTVILYEAQSGVRQIFTDGRKLPTDPQPWWYGYSIGHWDGDTLVVETSGFRDDVWLDVEGSPLTSTGKMTERFTRVDYGHLNIEITIEDPKAYTKPFTVTVKQRILLNSDLIEFICNENEKDASHLTSK